MSLDKMESIGNDIKETSYLALQKITKTLKQDLMKDIENPSELKALVNSVTDAMKMHSLITGNVTSRSESVTHNLQSTKRTYRIVFNNNYKHHTLINTTIHRHNGSELTILVS